MAMSGREFIFSAEGVSQPGWWSYRSLPKAALDTALLLAALPFTLPVFAAIWLAIRIDSPGPALLRVTCVGRNGKTFRQYRFRCIRVESTGNGQSSAESDPQLTSLGSFLIRSSLNHLPQILNVLRGEMALVGPRPLRAVSQDRIQLRIASLVYTRPGILNPSILNATPETTAHECDAIDLAYAHGVSLRLDMRVLRRALGAIFRG